jgi:hypothetical protein
MADKKPEQRLGFVTEPLSRQICNCGTEIRHFSKSVDSAAGSLNKTVVLQFTGSKADEGKVSAIEVLK